MPGAGTPKHSLASLCSLAVSFARRAIYSAGLSHGLGWNALIDVSLAFIPITIVGGLKLDVRKRIELCILMGLGILYVSSYLYAASTGGADETVKRCY